MWLENSYVIEFQFGVETFILLSHTFCNSLLYLCSYRSIDLLIAQKRLCSFALTSATNAIAINMGYPVRNFRVYLITDTPLSPSYARM